MILETRYSGPTDTRGSKITVTATGGDNHTDYRQIYSYPHEASNAHTHCVDAFLKALVPAGHCPVIVNAGEAANGRGYRYVILDASASNEAGIKASDELGFAPENRGNIFRPAHLSLPMVPAEGDRVALALHLDAWMRGFRYGTVEGRQATNGLKFRVRPDDGMGSTLAACQMSRADFSSLSRSGDVAWDFPGAPYVVAL